MATDTKLAVVRKGVLATATWLAVAATFSLAAYSLLLNRTATAAVAATFTLALVIFKQLPIVESFKVFSLEAKFIRRIDEADKLLGRIRSSAEVSSRLLYHQVALGDRMASMPWATKRAMTADFDELLASLGVPAETIADLKKPLLHIINLDLFRVFEYSARDRMQKQFKRASDALDAYRGGKAIDPADPEYVRLLSEMRGAKLTFETKDDLLDDGRLDDMDQITTRLIDGAPLPASDREKLDIIRREVVEHAKACRALGNITPEAELYLNSYSRRVDSRVKELFGDGS